MIKLLATLFTLSAWFRSRKYKSGTIWCFWRWTDVDSEYILRLHVLKTPWFAVCLHWIRKPDADPWLHDHPVSFLSIILRGSYTELRKMGDGKPYHKVNRWFNFVRASRNDRHRIIFARSNTLTLCFMGPKTREWGFHVWTEVEPTGWIMWKDYYKRLRAGENMRQLLSLARLDKIMQDVYTPERINALAGAPDGKLVEEETMREKISEQLNEDLKAGRVFLVSREDFYKKVRLPGDFDDEEPTEPR